MPKGQPEESFDRSNLIENNIPHSLDFNITPKFERHSKLKNQEHIIVSARELQDTRERWKAYTEIRPEKAVVIDAASKSVREMLQEMEVACYNENPIHDCKNCLLLEDACADITREWGIIVDEGSIELTARHDSFLEALPSYLARIEYHVDQMSAFAVPGERPGMVREAFQTLAKALYRYYTRISAAELRRSVIVEHRKQSTWQQGLKRRAKPKATGGPHSRRVGEDIADLGLDPKSDSESETPHKPTLTSPGSTLTSAPWKFGSISFPPNFYPPSQIKFKISIFFYDRNTLWFIVFILTVASGIFSGMAFFNTDYPLYSSLSQMFRLYASLWCLLIPLLRDKTLPIWPARGWLYAAVGQAAALSVLSVVFCKIHVGWSTMIACFADFAALGATVLLALGLMGATNSAVHYCH